MGPDHDQQHLADAQPLTVASETGMATTAEVAYHILRLLHQAT